MNTKAQNLVEYILLFAAVIIVLVVFLNPAGKYRSQLENSVFNGPVNQLQNMSTQLKY